MSSPVSQPSDAKFLWRNISRADTPKRSVTDRIADFFEVYCDIDEKTVQEQASRCLQCPEAPCVEGCPMGNRIPEWMALVEEGRFKDASELLTNSGCIPEIVSRLCRQDCESYCVLEGLGQPISINAIERFLNHYALEHELSSNPRQPPNGLRVAVVGSGPCGLACASELAQMGYSVAIFDTHAVPGGFLVQGIPAFNLDRTLVRRQIRHLQNMGVEFHMGLNWGHDLSLQNLRNDYQAVFLGPCADQPQPLNIPGSHLPGVFQALDFLIQKNFSGAIHTQPIDLKAKRVAVLGAGDTALGCLRTAIRSGATQPICVYRRAQECMPCHPREFQEALEEGALFRFSTLVSEVVGNGARAVSALRCQCTQPGSLDATGRPQPLPIPGSDFDLPVDIVFVAYGFLPPPLISDARSVGIRLNQYGGIAVDENQMTSQAGVFAAGMIVESSMLLPIAVRDARRAARALHAFLAKANVSRLPMKTAST